MSITLKRPRLGFNFPARTLRAVDFPMPFVPTSPKTCPGLGTGNLNPEEQQNSFKKTCDQQF